jgi:hypothetical protein
MSRELLDYAGIEYDETEPLGVIRYRGLDFRVFNPGGRQYDIVLSVEYNAVIGKTIPFDVMLYAPVSVTMLVLIKKGI